MPDINQQGNEQNSARNYELEEQEQRVREELARLHRMQQEQGAQAFADTLHTEATNRDALRDKEQAARFNPVPAEIPGITREEIPQAPIEAANEVHPVQDLNRSLGRGQETTEVSLERVIDGKVDRDPADLINDIDDLMSGSKAA